MKITRTSAVSGITRTLDLDITPEQMRDYAHGVLLQVAFPDLSKEDREFIKSGITGEEWDKLFADEE